MANDFRDKTARSRRADSNDCLNLGDGESAMLSFLHHWALRTFVEAAQYLGRADDARSYCVLAEKVRAACERELWDGQWYIRGLTAKGVKVGTRESQEGKVFIESNTWAVVSGDWCDSPASARFGA